ncbi:MAG: hypothetical protein IPK85_23510 [Gemmatimonadetes bacterium]|nr:hypothetical protein [Gemmatimonadota bacterium]
MRMVLPRVRMVLRSCLVAFCLIVAPSACASAGSRGARATGSTEVLRADELRRSGATDLLSAIRMLRPAFLQTRGRTSITRSEESEVAVYLDDRPFGGLTMLREIQINVVIEVRHFSATQAQVRWGGDGHSQGAILVITGAPRPE